MPGVVGPYLEPLQAQHRHQKAEWETNPGKGRMARERVWVERAWVVKAQQAQQVQEVMELPQRGPIVEIGWGEASGLVLAVDLLNPTPQAEARKHKLKMLVPAPRSFFMDVKCPGCFAITTVFSHAQTVVICAGCSTVLCQPTGGKARLTEGCSFRRK
ncbi:40S ribosomal protein S27 [Emergomyces africanus]|uniref:40S ribosomal protein S27 n=1 Tax=Emergomyces africanus TaxID=1955775 RepID=A0A1B7P3W1_9EURO|nr:40S ribosomal protein S27 [Emergomyces africanus]